MEVVCVVSLVHSGSTLLEVFDFWRSVQPEAEEVLSTATLGHGSRAMSFDEVIALPQGQFALTLVRPGRRPLANRRRPKAGSAARIPLF